MSEQPCAFHPSRLTGVRCSRCERAICPDDMIEAPVGFHCRECVKREAQTVVRARGPLPGMLAGARATSVIIAANVAVFVAMMLTGAPTSGGTLYRFGALTGLLPASQWWRLITATFVHIGLAHLAFNMFALTLFGGTIEHRYGTSRYLGLYVCCGVAGSATSLAFTQAELSAGASGAIFGIMGAWLAIVIRHRASPAMRGQLRSWLFLIGINLVFSRATPGIDLHAHLGGLVAGFVIASALELSVARKGPARAVLGAGGFLAVVAASWILTASNVV